MGRDQYEGDDMWFHPRETWTLVVVASFISFCLGVLVAAP